MQWFWRHYLGTIPTAPVDGATLLRTPDLTGLPPATLIMAQYDPLRDEGLAYADALRAAGNAVHAEVAPGMIHGFFSMFQIVPDAVPFIESAGARLRGDLG